MQPIVVIFSIFFFISTVFAQLPPNFFGGFNSNSLSSGFPLFPTTAQQLPATGNGRASTGMRPEGPILFPPSPESRDTSGVVVGASGYGFIPPNVMTLVQQGRAINPSPFSASYSQPFSSNFFNL